MSDTSLIQERRASDGTIAGIAAKGSIFFDDSTHGLVFVSPSGFLFRMRVDDNGNFFGEQLTI